MSRMRLPQRLSVAFLPILFVAACGGAAQVAPQGPPSLSLSPAQRSGSPVDDSLLAKEVRLEQVLALVDGRDPEARAWQEQAAASESQARASARLPDPEFRYQLWGAHLSRPYDLRMADAHMFGFVQSFPAPGTLDAAREGGQQQARSAEDSARARKHEAELQAERAFFEYARLDEELRIHADHMGLLRAMAEATRIQFVVSRTSLLDVSRFEMEMSRLHADVASSEQSRRSLAGLLNQLMQRSLSAPLGKASLPSAEELERRLELLRSKKPLTRPEVDVARREVKRAEAALVGARSSSKYPAFMVGIDYMLMPERDDKHGYGVMAQMSIPWVNPRHGEEVRAAERRVASASRSLDAQTSAYEYQRFDAVIQAESASHLVHSYENEIVPRARKSFELARALYASSQADALMVLDSERTYMQARMDSVRARARFAIALAAFKRAMGGAAVLGPRKGDSP